MRVHQIAKGNGGVSIAVFSVCQYDVVFHAKELDFKARIEFY